MKTETAAVTSTLHERSRWVFDHLPALKTTVLDVGCHDGFGLRAFSHGARLGVGIDLDVSALRLGAAPYGQVRLLVASADALPFRDGSFDCVVFSEVLEHVQSSVEEKCISELRRVMTPGGTLLLTTPHRGMFWWLDPLMAKTHLRRLGARLAGKSSALKGHKHYLVDEVRRLLDPHFEVLLLERRACLLHPLAYWGHLVTARCGPVPSLLRFWQAVMDSDYSHEYGAAAYNVCVVARAR